MIHLATAPWEATLSQPQYMLTFYFLVLAGLALFAGFVRAWTTRDEVGSRYRTAVVARLCVMGVAFLSYVVLIIGFTAGYDSSGAEWIPNAAAINTFAPRYIDWSVTVPLLTVELLAVSTLVGPVARRTRFIAMTGAFLMIFTGYLGAIVIDNGENPQQLLLWGGVSSVFWIAVNIILIRAVRGSLPALTSDSALLLRQATVLLLAGWAIYPLAYSIQIFAFGGGWTTTMQITLCVADVAVKLGFSGMIHRVAKLRTAEDVRAGEDIHPESIWISSIKRSDAAGPPETYLPEGAPVNGPPRTRPPTSAAVTAPPEPEHFDYDE